MLYVLKYRYVFTRLYIMQSEAVAGQNEIISAPILGGAGGRLRREGAASDRSMRRRSPGRCGRSTWHGMVHGFSGTHIICKTNSLR